MKKLILLLAIFGFITLNSFTMIEEPEQNTITTTEQWYYFTREGELPGELLVDAISCDEAWGDPEVGAIAITNEPFDYGNYMHYHKIGTGPWVRFD